MTEQEFAALVARLEPRAQRDPAGYRTRALLLAFCGNAYLATVLAVIAGLILALVAMLTVLKAVAIKFAIVLGGFLWMVLRAVWIRLPPPTGIEVTREGSPELFALIDALRDALQSPRFHHVLVTGDFNAAVCQVPRFGMFAGTRNYLLLGLTLMKTLGVEQFRAVLAHEFGHLARGHGRLGNWIYCQRLRWARLAAALDETESSGKFLFEPLLRRFVPYFTAYSFPLARANEYQADAAAVRLTSAQAMSEALTAVNVLGSYLHERYWPTVHGDADVLPQPRFLPYAGLTERFAGEFATIPTTHWLEEALQRQTDCADTHPSLSDRLKAIGEPPRLVPPRAGDAADRLLGPALASVTARLDEEWREAILPSWQAHHQSVRDARERHATLGARVAARDSLSADERIEHAVLTETVGRDAELALQRLREVVASEPDHAVAAFALGVRLLDRDDEAGVALLERVMAQDPSCVPQVAVRLHQYAARHGREEDARRWETLAIEASRKLEHIDREETTVRLRDTFLRHGLDGTALARLRQALAVIPHLKRAYLVRKRIPIAGEEARLCYVLGIAMRAWTGSARATRSAGAVAQLQQSPGLPPGTVIMPVDGPNYRFGRKFFWMRGARVY
jgi:Zn-dependent protease with chaperone function